MKSITKILLPFLCINFFFASCKKDKAINQLPPATQTGANTFGCYINGKLFVPRGYRNPYPSYRMIVDPGANGNLDVRTYSYQNNIETGVGFSSFGIIGTGIYIAQSTSLIFPYSHENANSDNCNFTSSNSNYKLGVLKITRYDLQNGIISGEFDWKLYDNAISCDTIRITQGRFDKKL